jgi:hypothetical protein
VELEEITLAVAVVVAVTLVLAVTVEQVAQVLL